MTACVRSATCSFLKMLETWFCTVLRLSKSQAGELPAPEDVLLPIEVSDTSLSYDREIKLFLYGRSDIPEKSSSATPSRPKTATASFGGSGARKPSGRKRCRSLRFGSTPCSPDLLASPDDRRVC
jgi:hypothetical protein